MRNFKLVLEYDGTRYQGWQRLSGNDNTIQGRVETTLSRILEQEIAIAGSGRTDAGTHARGQVASFHAQTQMSPAAILRQLRRYLPEDIGAVSLEEAAAIDGSSFSKTLWQIILPICKPILVTVAIIQVFGNWNEFSFALVLIKDVALQTVPLALTQFKGQFASDYPKQMAAMLITMSPIVILYFAFSKEIIKGMVAGAVKG